MSQSKTKCPAGLEPLQCALTPRCPPVCWALEPLGVSRDLDARVLLARKLVAAGRGLQMPMLYPGRTNDGRQSEFFQHRSISD